MIFDGHCDLWENVDEKRARGLTHIIKTYHVPAWERGNVMAGFYPIWVNTEWTPSVEIQADRILKHQKEELTEASDYARVVRDYTSYKQAISDGVHAMFLGAEGLSFIGSDVSIIDSLYNENDFRIASLTWNENNLLASGSNLGEDGGLTSLGRKAIQRMNSLGMIVDLAHASKKSFWDAMSTTQSPIVVSHGNAAGLCEALRNYDDNQLRAIRDCSGVIGVCSYPDFVALDKTKQTVETYVNHIAYIADLIGAEHVAMGFDSVDYLDDFGTDPMISDSIEGFVGVAESYNIIAQMKSSGFSNSEIEMVSHTNFERIIDNIL